VNSNNTASSTDELDWFKSSYSGGEGGNCVEVAHGSSMIHLRDSKDAQGPQLTFSPAEWAAFVAYASAAH
jgi:hypothetical protein